MQQHSDYHKFEGMLRDLSPDRHPSNLLYDASNIRITSRGLNTLLNITNELGPKLLPTSVLLYSSSTPPPILGKCIGSVVLNNYLVLFTKGASDYIYRIDMSKLTSTTLSEVAGAIVQLVALDLNFSFDYPILAIASYETESILKVYWTDGLNLPRIINIADTSTTYNSNSFEFVLELQLNETINVETLFGNGEFPSGVIQYAITYYNKYGLETNIAYATPLYNIAFSDRGASSEEKIGVSFKLSITGLDTNFDFLRIYSILRTSKNATPICKIVLDINIKENSLTSVEFIDTGLIGESVDPTELLYKGGETITARTLTLKDNTLFLGNLSISRELISSSLKTSISTNINSSLDLGDDSTDDLRRAIKVNMVGSSDYSFPYQLHAIKENTTYTTPCGGFKKGDYYRLGVLFQYKTGKWSEPIFIKDELITSSPTLATISTRTGTNYKLLLPLIKATLSSSLSTLIKNLGYKKIRPVIVFPTINDRVTICQGVACHTMYTVNHRSVDKDLYALSSWFFRPYYETASNPTLIDGTTGASMPCGLNTNSNGELTYMDGMWNSNPSRLRNVEMQGWFSDDNKFRINGLIMTLHSPDIEYDDSIINYDLRNKLRRTVGKAFISKTLSDIDIQTSTPPIKSTGTGFTHKSFSTTYCGIVAGPFYEDYVVYDVSSGSDDGKFTPSYEEKSPMRWFVYPWNAKGSLNNDIQRPANLGVKSAELKKKTISNLRYCNTEYNYSSSLSTNTISDMKVYTSNQTTIEKLIYQESDTDPTPQIYQGNIDTMLSADKADGHYSVFSGEDFRTAANTLFISTKYWKTWNAKYEVGASLQADYTTDPKGMFVWNNSGSNYWWGDTTSPEHDGPKKKADDNTLGLKYEDLTIHKPMIRMRYRSTPHIIFNTGSDSGVSITLGTESREDHKLMFPIVEILNPGDDSTSFYRSTMFGGTSEEALKLNLWIPCGDPVILNTSGTDFYYSYGDTYFQRWDCLKTYPFSFEDENQIVEIGSFMLESRVNIDGRYDRNRGLINNTNMSPTNFNLYNPIYTQQDNFFNYRILDLDYYDLNRFPNLITWTKEKLNSADIDLWTNITLASTYDLDGSKGEIKSLNTWMDNIYCFQPKGISNILFNSRVQIPVSEGAPIEITNSYKVDGSRYIADKVGCNSFNLIKEAPSGIYFINSMNNNLYQVGGNGGLADVAATHNMSSWYKNNIVDKLLYDEINHDLYSVADSTSLVMSEILGLYISFYPIYKGLKYMGTYNMNVYSGKDCTAITNGGTTLYHMFNGVYGVYHNGNSLYHDGSYITFVSNGISDNLYPADKVFENIDYRMDYYNNSGVLLDNSTFNYVQVTNEYLDTGVKPLVVTVGTSSILKKLYRTWRILIPRQLNSRNRIRNNWCNVTIGYNPTLTSTTPQNLEGMFIFDDINVTYYTD